MCKSTKICTQLNTQYYRDDNTEQFKPHFTDFTEVKSNNKKYKITLKGIEY